MSKWVKLNEQLGKQNEQMGKWKLLKCVKINLQERNKIKKLWNIYQSMINSHKKWIGTPLGPYKCFVTLCGQDSADPLLWLMIWSRKQNNVSHVWSRHNCYLEYCVCLLVCLICLPCLLDTSYYLPALLTSGMPAWNNI